MVHLQYGELGLESGKQSWGSNGRIRHRNDLAVAAEGRLIAFEGGWLRLACGSDGEVWVPEHAVRAVEFMTEESFRWRNGPPPGWTPERD